MEKIKTDYKQRTCKLEAKLFKMSKQFAAPSIRIRNVRIKTELTPNRFP